MYIKDTTRKMHLMTSNEITVAGTLSCLSSKRNCTIAAPVSTLKTDKSRLRGLEMARMGLHSKNLPRALDLKSSTHQM